MQVGPPAFLGLHSVLLTTTIQPQSQSWPQSQSNPTSDPSQSHSPSRPVGKLNSEISRGNRPPLGQLQQLLQHPAALTFGGAMLEHAPLAELFTRATACQKRARSILTALIDAAAGSTGSAGTGALLAAQIAGSSCATDQIPGSDPRGSADGDADAEQAGGGSVASDEATRSRQLEALLHEATGIGLTVCCDFLDTILCNQWEWNVKTQCRSTTFVHHEHNNTPKLQIKISNGVQFAQSKGVQRAPCSPTFHRHKLQAAASPPTFK